MYIIHVPLIFQALFYLTAFIVKTIKALRHWVALILKSENQSLWQKLNSFNSLIFVMFLFINIIENQQICMFFPI